MATASDSESDWIGDQLVEVCGFLLSFLDDGKWEPQSDLEALVLGTLARSRATFETIVSLVVVDRSLQASMLSRSLFEDMVVSHWLVLHRDDPDWLVARFHEHADAMRLHAHDVRVSFGLPPADDVTELEKRRPHLQKEFGRFAERDWWGQTSDGSRISMAQAIRVLADAEDFRPRLRGEQPILEQYFGLQQKLWTQSLHHTAAGTASDIPARGDFPDPVRPTEWFFVLFGNYWVFGQSVQVALQLAAPAEAQHHFDRLFVAGLTLFGAVSGVADDHVDLAEAWLEQTEPPHG